MQRFSLDIRDTILPFSLLEISCLFQKMKVGSVIEILTNSQNVLSDLKLILHQYDYNISQRNVMIDNQPSIQIFLKKKRPAGISPIYRNASTSNGDH
jgi:TusA-related sulfurtransferase